MRNRPIPKIAPADRAFVEALVIYEDSFILVFDKPAGLPVQTRGNRGRNLDHLIWAFARSNGKRPRLVHRIDAGTSGLLVAAKTQPVSAFLSEQFADRRVEKTYFALVSGDLPSEDAGVSTAALTQTGAGHRQSVVVDSALPGAQAAETAWRVMSRSGDKALIEARPKTGRMHQIRAHLKHLGCPILGDPLYGAGEESAPRMMLHAAGLTLPMPEGDPVSLEAPVPADFRDWQTELCL